MATVEFTVHAHATDAKPIRMRAAAQDGLAELLAATSPAVRARSEQLAMQQPAGAAVNAAGRGFIPQMVSLGTHRRYGVDFRALACGRVSARAALGKPSDESAPWLGSVLGWTPMGGPVERREARASTPPGDVVMAARAYLAGPR